MALERAPESAAAHAAMLPRFAAALDEARALLLAQPLAARRAAWDAAPTFGPFALAYFPGDITAPLAAWGQMIHDALKPEPAPLPPARERVRLGLLSAQIYRQSVWKILLRGLVGRLDGRFFELVVFNASDKRDDETDWCRQRAARFYEPRHDWRPLLAEEAPDVLFLPDTAMSNACVEVAAQRFAPLQVTTWGHPVSSGLASVDLYLSGELIEPEDAAGHYVERLVRLPGTGACTPNMASERQPLPEALQALLAEGRPLALVPCYVFKLVPADDGLWVALARRYPELRLVFFAQSAFTGEISTRNLTRIRAAFAAADLAPDAHLAVVEILPPAAFHTLLEQAALYLDAPSFSGYTTAWQGVFCGIPIVTLEGRFMRQRLAAGLLRAIGCAETVVSDEAGYLAKVGELLDEWRHRPAAYQARRARIRAAAPLACNDERVVRAFERVLLEELAARGSETAQRLLPQHRAAYPGYDYRPDEHRVIAPPRLAPANLLNPEATVPQAPTAAVIPSIPQAQEAAMPGAEFFAAQPLIDPTLTPANPPSATAGAPPAATSAAPSAAQPVWKMLEADLHLATLSHSYAPVGLLQMIPPAPRAVFDLGCFVGGSGRWLKERFPGVLVEGIELLPKAAELARAHYDAVYTGRFEDFPVEQHAGRFDTLIAADVLEHLFNPWAALERMKTLLAPGGALYVSLPNVRNLRVIQALVNGEWRYEGAGILDITHLRFFTRQSALAMLAETGWQVLETRANLDPALAPLLQGRDLAAIRNIELHRCRVHDLAAGEALEFFALQWFFRCQPK